MAALPMTSLMAATSTRFNIGAVGLIMISTHGQTLLPAPESERLSFHY
jgi:hypothetical protein